MTPERWQQVRDLLASAMQLAPEKREHYLAQECRSDPSLRADLDSLLSADADLSTSFLTGEALHAAASRTRTRSTRLQPGTILGRYEIVGLIGAGGMGEVYRARDTQLPRAAAIKVLPSDLSFDPERRKRFQREAHAIATLQHAHICTLYDVGSQDGVDFLVMEFLEGETLAERLRKGALPFDHALRFASEMADALDAAHRRGIVHRDLKPGNVFVTTHGECKLLDFGLAKIEDPQSGLETPTAAVHDPKGSTPGVAMGTVSYMSPEQARGDRLDGRTDIFSLGAVLYEMATGKVAFPGRTPAVVFKGILDGTPTSALRLNPSLPSELEGIISRALEKEPDLRFQHASDMRAELQSLKGRSESTRIAAASASPGYTRTRRKLLLIVAASVFFIGVAVIGPLYRGSGTAPQIDSIAVLPFTNGSGDASTDYLGDGITESLIDNLAHVPQLRVKSRNSVSRYKGKDVDVTKVGNDLHVLALVVGRVVPKGDSIEVSAELTDVRDNTVIWGQHYSGRSADIIWLQQQIAGDIAGRLRSKLSTSERQQVTKQGTQDPEAYQLYLKGRYAWNKRTLSDTEIAISYFNQAIAKDPGYGLAFSGLADAYDVLPDYGGSPSENYTKSNIAARKALALDATLARPHATLGENEMEYDWDFAGGEAEFKRALQLDPNDATAHQWYGEKIAMIGGREQEARAQINRAHQLDPESAIISTMDGFVHALARQYDEAIVVYKKVANENPKFARVHRQLAYAYWGKRMYGQVIEEWKTYGELSGNQKESEFASALEQGFRSEGWRGALANGIEARQKQRKTGYWPPFEIAQLYADLGDEDRTFRWLNTAYQERDPWLLGLKTEFLLDPMRSDPRFAALVSKVGLPQ